MSMQRLLSCLADGQPHHVRDLAQFLQCTPQQLNHWWQQTPEHLHSLLRQRDGVWQLSRPLAWLDESARIPDFTLTVLPQTSSSNDVLLDAVRAGSLIHKRVIVAHTQSSGRGRQGRVWQHRLGECLMFSVGWTLNVPMLQLGALALVVALACQRGLAQLGCETQIKWPNDLVVGMDKLGGVLIETLRHNNQTHAVMGIGINFMLPQNVDNAIGVQAACNTKPTAHAVLSAILAQLNHLIPSFEQHGFAPLQAAYEAVHRDHQQEIVLLRHDVMTHSGRVLGVNEMGALRLQTPSGEQQIVSGEISLRRPEQITSESAGCLQHHLLLDCGNSRLKWAWVENGEIVRTQAAHYRDLTALNEDWAQFGMLHTQIFGSAVCGAEKQQAVQAALPRSIKWLPSMTTATGIRNHYHNVAEHGADRWFNALGSRQFTENACVIVSCGTAVTIDALTDNNHYLGGSIMPGFHLMRESLLRRTAQLNRPEGMYYPFPTSTANAIATGMTDAVCGALMMMHTRLQQRTSGKVDVVITGGGARKIAHALPATFVLDNHVKIVDNLVFFGLLRWIQQHHQTDTTYTQSVPKP